MSYWCDLSCRIRARGTWSFSRPIYLLGKLAAMQAQPAGCNISELGVTVHGVLLVPQRGYCIVQFKRELTLE
jgi:hypothetical protein